MSYQDFIESKLLRDRPTGFDEIPDLNQMLYDWQDKVVSWALKRGKAAIFADCGLGKTPMQLEWAKRVAEKAGSPVLIVAPLAVSSQTVREGDKFGIDVEQIRGPSEVGSEGLYIVNYEILEKFDPSVFGGVVLDESSILKSYEGKYRNLIIDMFSDTPYRLACTATPAPNDHMELANHSEFLGIMPRQDMLATFFIHDSSNTQQWRLKGHAEDFPLEEWRKLASPTWRDIHQGDVLDYREAREENDEKHICPLQLEVIERALKLWSAEGDTVFSPFAGIGSEGYVALDMAREFIGVELKPSYWEQAVRHLTDLTTPDAQKDMLEAAQ